MRKKSRLTVATGCLPMPAGAVHTGDCRASNPYTADPWQPLHIHHAASHVTGRVSLLKITLPSWCSTRRCGWRITIVSAARYLGPQHAGGGACGDANPPRRGKRKPEYLQWLASLAGRRAMPMRYLFIWNAARLTCGFRLGTAAQRRRDARTAATPGYIQAGYSLLNAPVAARWHGKFSTH